MIISTTYTSIITQYRFFRIDKYCTTYSLVSSKTFRILTLNIVFLFKTYICSPTAQLKGLVIKREKTLSHTTKSLLQNWQLPTLPLYAVPSARLGLTSLFGMGRGGSPTL